MSSPFSIFRKHQKIMLVVLIGLSMLSFVIFDAIQQAGNIGQMPAVLTVLTLALLIGAVAWVAGIGNQKSSEYGSIGLIAGAALGLVIALQTRKTDTATLGEFAMTQNELNSLANSRYTANRFLYLAVEKTNPNLGEFERNMLIQQNQFTFGHPEEQLNQDVILGELLRREATKVGMSLPDDAVYDFISKATNDKMSREAFQEIRKELRVSEAQVVDSIRQELLAREAALTLYSRLDLPPAVDWKFSQRLQVRQTATTAGVPIAQFIDEKVEPPTAELQELFDRYKANLPNITPAGKYEEGLPGFYQPPRVKLAYVTPDYQAFEQQVAGEVSDQEIEARYQRDYVDAAKPPVTGPMIPDFSIPGLEGPQLTPPAKATGEAAPPATTTPPAETPPPAAETPPATEAAPSTDKAPSTTPATETPAAPATPEAKPQGDNGCDDAPAEKPAEAATPAAEAPKTETPAELPATTDAPKTDAPAADAPKSDAPAATIPDAPEPAPPVPSSSVRPLDDELKAEIREQILAEKTNLAIEAAMATAIEKIRNEISIHVHSQEGTPNRLTPEAATKQIQDYAAANNFRYVESELLSYEEMLKSDDVPVAQFRLQTGNFLSQPTVADQLFGTAPKSTFQPQQATDRDRAGKVVDRAIYWKLQHEKSYEPTTLDEERVRKAVVQSWRDLKARELAEKRAAEIAELVRKSDKPMLETLADVTVTGQPNATLLSIVQTGQFSWMRQQIVPAMTMQGFDFAPVRSTVPGVEQAGDDFMRVVFDDLKAGDVGVAPNADRSVYYVVKIDTRIPGNEEEWTTLRNNFLSGQNDPALERLEAEMYNREVPFWANELFRKYDVRLPEPGGEAG